MATLKLNGVTKRYPNGVEAVIELDLDVADGEFMVLVGPSGCGKTTALRMVAGLEDITDGDDRGRRARRQRPLAARSRHGDGVPELRALPAHDGRREHRLLAQPAEDAEGRDASQGRGGGSRARPDRAPRPQAGAALRRAAPARRDGSRDRALAGGVPDGRAAVEPRRQAARAHARGGLADPAAARRRHAVRHPRPGRGDDDGRPRRRDAQPAACSSARDRRRSTTRPRTCSSPRSSARRR